LNPISFHCIPIFQYKKRAEDDKSSPVSTKSLGVVIPPKGVDADDEFEEQEECPFSAEI
jgi:hypothetical protein